MKIIKDLKRWTLLDDEGKVVERFKYKQKAQTQKKFIEETKKKVLVLDEDPDKPKVEETEITPVDTEEKLPTLWDLETASKIYIKETARIAIHKSNIEDLDKLPNTPSIEAKKHIQRRMISGLERSIQLNVKSYRVTVEQVKEYVADPNNSFVESIRERENKEKLDIKRTKEIQLAKQNVNFYTDELEREKMRTSSGLSAGVISLEEAEGIIQNVKQKLQEAKDKLRDLKIMSLKGE